VNVNRKKAAMASPALLNLITAFAATGEIGPLRCGMGRGELEAALRDLGLITLAEPGPEDSGKFGSIEVHLTRGTLRLLGLDSMGDCSFEVPGTLARGSAGREHVSHEEVIGALASHGISWSEDSQLTFPGEQLAIKTASGVGLVFTDDHPEWAIGLPPGLLLDSMYKHEPGWTGG
jgi:hypothetical protein